MRKLLDWLDTRTGLREGWRRFADHPVAGGARWAYVFGSALLFPGSRLETLFAWAPAHPVVDVYRSYKPMPFDMPLNDLAAVHYAVKPDAGVFGLSDPGTLSIASDGNISFVAGSGNARKMLLEPGKTPEALDALLAMAAAQPALPAGRGRQS